MSNPAISNGDVNKHWDNGRHFIYTLVLKYKWKPKISHYLRKGIAIKVVEQRPAKRTKVILLYQEPTQHGKWRYL